MMLLKQSYAESKQWHKSFAWRPVKTIHGEWVWLEMVDRISYHAREISSSAPFTTFGGWCFRRLGSV